MRTKLFATGAAAVLGGAMALAASAGTTAVAAVQTQTFDYTGDAQTWVVPAGITSATFDVWGAQGGDNHDDGGCPDIGGYGGHTQATISVTPGQTITIVVGGRGGPSNGGDSPDSGAGGFNGGGDAGGADSSSAGGGGGASDVRVGGTDLADRSIVAGGGGGVGSACGGANNGGAGSGDNTTGGTGGEGTVLDHGTPGTGGAAAAGGVGGDFGGTDGSFGLGGAGGLDADHNTPGGGGGGGYYGGGGGGAGIFHSDPGDGGAGGGGGGGGGLCPSTCVAAESGVRAGNGLVTVTFGTADPTPAPANVVPASPRFTG